MNFHIYALVSEPSPTGGLSEGLRNSTLFSHTRHGQETDYRNTQLLSLPCPKLSSPLLRTSSAATSSLNFHWLIYIAVRMIFPRERLIFPVFYSKPFNISPFYVIQSKPEYSVENGNRKSF